MLVLTRRIGEQIVMPSLGIAVTVLESRGGVVRLGISAPAEIVVLRQELSPGMLHGGGAERPSKIRNHRASPRK